VLLSGSIGVGAGHCAEKVAQKLPGEILPLQGDEVDSLTRD